MFASFSIILKEFLKICVIWFHLIENELLNRYSVSHKVEISERFKSHRTEFKSRSSNLKHVEKN